MVSETYEPLYAHLINLKESEWRASFAAIEVIIGRPFPNSARDYSAWWSNGSKHTQSFAWLEAGWETSELNLTGETIRFSRTAYRLPQRSSSDIPDVATKKSETDRTVVNSKLLSNKASEKFKRFELRLAWLPVGEVGCDASGRLLFPEIPSCPGLYRFKFEPVGTNSVYFGETDNLRRRFNHYRNPDPSQKTNLRLNKLFHRAIRDGHKTSLAVVVDTAWIGMDGVENRADLSEKAERVLLEHVAILEAKSEAYEILNR